MSWPTVSLGEVSEHCLGKMLDAQKNKGTPYPYLRNPNVRWMDVDLSEIKEMPFEDHELDRYGLKAGDVVICEGGEAGRAAIWDGSIPHMKIQKAIHRVRVGPSLDNRYLVHRIRHDYFRGALSDYYTGATIKHLTGQDLARYRFPLPPLDEQRRIAAILDAADSLRAKRRAVLAKLDQLAQSIFIEMFGDPASNPKKWPIFKLRDLAAKFSDGPFGSNLKSEHYVEAGVRVIRLQNIGVGKLVDTDKAFISETHFNSISKHECLPGDVIVGTLGDPNLRACILPPTIKRALNKADCVQIRADDKRANAAYICALLNVPSTEKMAQGLILGQTRSRISMGRLRDLEVPVPPLDLQIEFKRSIAALERLTANAKQQLRGTGVLFASLQHRAFRGEL